MSELTVFTEQTGTRVLLRNMQSNLDLYKSERMIAGQLEEMVNLVHTNPVGRIIPPPENYQGEFSAADPMAFSPGEWYFDKDKGYLVYRVVHEDYFISDLPPPARIRLALEASFIDIDGNGLFDRGVDRFTGLILRKVDKWEWD